ncbi:MAG: pentapeptide repeat-containing protein [Planctomycetota bacterium]
MSTRDYGTEYEFQPGAQCNLAQYRRLVECSKSDDVDSWNKWRIGHPGEEIWLCGVDLTRASLDRINLGNAHLEGSVLTGARLEKAVLCEAHLDGAVLWQARLDGANLWQASLWSTKLWRARLRKAVLLHVAAQEAFLREADLRDADLSNADLQGAVLSHAHIEGAELKGALLQGADLQFAFIDGSTGIFGCRIDRQTDFTGVGLESGRIEPGIGELLRYNIRRKRWQAWYRQGPRWLQLLKWTFIAPFWWMSDYGHSMGRILSVFVLLALVFAGIYYLRPAWLVGLKQTGGWAGGVHAVYFSVVTMTTLGFGDIHANPDAWQGQILLMVQVICGYVLLGALITRLATLFTAGGPPARPAPRAPRRTAGRTHE